MRILYILWTIMWLFTAINFYYIVSTDTLAVEEIETQTKPIVDEVKQEKQDTIQHTWRPVDSIVQEYVDYAREISWHNLDFIGTLDAENWQWNPHRQSEVVKNWIREDSYWFCMIHRQRHSDVVDNPLFWNDWKRQLDQCWNKYKWWTRFYWYDVRHKSKARFTITRSTPVWVYIEARKTQDKADSLRAKCLKVWECKE